jgi:hypothetical protein
MRKPEQKARPEYVGSSGDTSSPAISLGSSTDLIDDAPATLVGHAELAGPLGAAYVIPILAVPCSRSRTSSHSPCRSVPEPKAARPLAKDAAASLRSRTDLG